MSDKIKKKYYSTYEISRDTHVTGENIQYWLNTGMLEKIQPIDVRRGRRIYTLFQRYFIKRMARLMATGLYTVKGALASIESDVEIPIIKNASHK